MAQGERGYIGYKKEATWGVDPGGAATRFFPFISETLTPKIEELMSAAQRGILDEPLSFQGERSFAGDLLLEVHPVSIGHILRSALGAPAAEALADSVETVLENCEDLWTGHEDVIVELDSADKKKGTYSNKITVPAGVADTTILAYEDFAGVDMGAVTALKFWIKTSIDLIAEDLEILISETGGVAGAPLVLDVGVLVANTWTEVTVATGDLSGGAYDTVISVGLRLGADLAQFTIRIDDVRMVVAGTATTAYKHVFTPMQTLAQEFAAGAQDSPLWPYTFDIFRDQGVPFSILGAVVNTLNLSFSTSDKIMKAACGILAKNGGVGTAAGIALEATKPFVWENAKIGVGGTYAGSPNNNLESFSLTWDNKCIEKFLLNNTAIPAKIIKTGYREVPVSFVIDFVDRTEYNHFLSGTERQFQIILEGSAVPGDAASTPYTLQLDLPLVRYLTYPINIGGPGRMMCAVTGKAKYSGGHVLQASLINAERTAEYAG